jgi:hypothetical protein
MWEPDSLGGPEALAAWQPPRTGQRGRPRDYSEVPIETGHLLRLALSVAAGRRPAPLHYGPGRPECRCARSYHVRPAQSRHYPRYGAGAGTGERAGPRRDRRDRAEGHSAGE